MLIIWTAGSLRLTISKSRRSDDFMHVRFGFAEMEFRQEVWDRRRYIDKAIKEKTGCSAERLIRTSTDAYRRMSG